MIGGMLGNSLNKITEDILRPKKKVKTKKYYEYLRKETDKKTFCIVPRCSEILHVFLSTLFIPTTYIFSAVEKVTHIELLEVPPPRTPLFIPFFLVTNATVVTRLVRNTRFAIQTQLIIYVQRLSGDHTKINSG